MRNLVHTGRGGVIIAAVLLVATGIAVRVRPNDAVGPVPGAPISGFWPTLAVIAALLVAVIATTAGAVSMARNPRAGRDLPQTPSWDWREMHIRLSYVALAFVAVVVALIVLAFGRHDLTPISTDVPGPPAAEQATPPPPHSPADPVVQHETDAGGSTAVIGFVVVATISLVILGATWHSTLRRRLRLDPASVELSPPPEPLVRATELALHEVVEPGRSPGEAIIACFATMERALANTEFAPRESDTAKDVIDRAVAQHFMPTGPAGQLRDLFTEARFSAHSMTAAQQDSAAEALHDILAGWRS